MLTFTPPGPEAERFMQSKNFVDIIMGPVGSGKSTAALFKILMRALNQPAINGVRRGRCIILRNTTAQLNDTIKPLIDQWFVDAAQNMMGAWKLTEKKFRMVFSLADNTRVDCELWLMAADNPDDVRRLLSVEASWAWVEEARELHEDVFSGLQGRVGRYPSKAMGGVVDACVLASTNPPPLGGFWHKVISDPPKGWGVFIQQPALLDDLSLNPARENPNLPDDYYDRLISGKTDEWIDVYLKNRFGIGNAGQPVYKTSFKRSFHVAKEELIPLKTKTYPVVVGMDNGLTAAAALLQQDTRGRVLLLDECFVPKGATMGVERFLDTMLVPLLRNKYFACDVVFVLDPACFQRSQINEKTIAQVVQSRGYRVQRAVTNDPDKRISAVEQLLVRQTDGQGHFLVSPHCTWAIEGFDYGYRYPPKRDGSANTEAPQKNHWSHFHDALQYAALHYNAGIAVDHRPQALPVQKVRYHYG